MNGSNLSPHTSCLGRTCLRWTPDGELDREEFLQVLARLAAVEGAGLRPCRREPWESQATGVPWPGGMDHG